MYEQKPRVCEICFQAFVCDGDFEKHFLTHKDETSYTYEFHDKVVSQLEDLEEHSEEKPYICDVCSKALTGKANFEAHLVTHEKEKTFVMCSEEFSRPNHLNEHLLSHTREKRYRSENLNDKDDEPSYYEKSFRKQKKKTNDKDDEPSYYEKEEKRKKHPQKRKKKHMCKMCSVKFACKRRLFFHFRTHMNGKRFACNVCNEAYSTRVRIREHVMKHVIEKKSASGAALSDQSQKDNKPYVCVMCKGEFPGLGRVNNHLLKIHTRVMPYICNICSKTFGHYEKESLKDHLQTHNQ